MADEQVTDKQRRSLQQIVAIVDQQHAELRDWFTNIPNVAVAAIILLDLVHLGQAARRQATILKALEGVDPNILHDANLTAHALGWGLCKAAEEIIKRWESVLNPGSETGET